MWKMPKSHMERELANMGDIVALKFDFWPATALQIRHYEPSHCLIISKNLCQRDLQFRLAHSRFPLDLREIVCHSKIRGRDTTDEPSISKYKLSVEDFTSFTTKF